MDAVVIEPYDESLFREVVTLLADAYVTNPINVAVFGGSGEKERPLNRGLFEVSRLPVSEVRHLANIGSPRSVLGPFWIRLPTSARPAWPAVAARRALPPPPPCSPNPCGT